MNSTQLAWTMTNIVAWFPTSCHSMIDFTLDILNRSLLRRVVASTQSRVDRRGLEAYDIDSTTGFFPSSPLPHLAEVFNMWEEGLEEARGCLVLGDDQSEEAQIKQSQGESWREKIKSWPVLDTEPLRSELRLLQRAHMVLAFLVHFFVHSQPTSPGVRSQIRVPKSLSLPLVEVSCTLGMAPVLTFADTVLWNWCLVDPSLPVSIDNIRHDVLFSETEDERNFYAKSAEAELKGAEALTIFATYRDIRDSGDMMALSKISRDLTRLAEIIQELSDVIDVRTMRRAVDPHVFYLAIRPWWKGSDPDGIDSPTWLYEGVSSQNVVDLGGPSAGQSSLMHALDLFLDIDHKLSERRAPAPTESNRKADVGFMERMRRYMPGVHREYLNCLRSEPSVRQLARAHPAVLRDPYNEAVKALKKLRDLHIRTACLYIITMSKASPPPGCPVAAMLRQMSAEEESHGIRSRGTGGTEVSLLLKAGRDATRRAML